MARLLVTVIADDLTGAADSAAPFAAAGLPTWVFLDRAREQGDLSVASIDTDSRTEGPAIAVARTRAAAEAAFRAGCPVIYKKIDSTLRGHVGPEVAAVLAVAVEAAPGGARPVVLMAPAFPATGRVVRSGRVVVDGGPLDVWPARLLTDAGLAVAAVGSATELGGAASLLSAIEDLAGTSVDVILCNAVSEDDLRAIAGAGARLPRPVVWVGSGGLARHLPRALGLGANGPLSADTGSDAAALAPNGPALVLVGSGTEVAQRQAAALGRDSSVEPIALAPEMLRAGEADPSWIETSARIDRALRAGRDAVAVISPGPESAGGVERDLAVALGRRAATRSQIGTLEATGGDTARAALRARGVEGYRLAGALEPGIPFGIAPADDGRPLLRIVTKAGGFGTEDTLVRCLASLPTAARSLVR